MKTPALLMVWMICFVLCRLYAGEQDGTLSSFLDEVWKYHSDNTNRVRSESRKSQSAFPSFAW